MAAKSDTQTHKQYTNTQYASPHRDIQSYITLTAPSANIATEAIHVFACAITCVVSLSAIIILLLLPTVLMPLQ